MPYQFLSQHVYNRGVPADDFLDQLVAWGRTSPDDIFTRNPFSDIYSSVFNTLGPYDDNTAYRRAVMLEVMRVLAGFESSWNWNEGPAMSAAHPTPDTLQAGAWQVSANAMNFGQELRDLVLAKVGATDATAFQRGMKENHPLAMEFVARLLRRTTQHHGSVHRHEIDPWLRRNAVAEFQTLIGR